MNLARTGAAFGLAALTLASSLSLGAAAHAAPTAQSASGAARTPAATSISNKPFVLRGSDGQFYAVFYRYDAAALWSSRVTAFASYQEAAAAAVHITYNADESKIHIDSGAAATQCLGYNPLHAFPAALSCADPNASDVVFQDDGQVGIRDRPVHVVGNYLAVDNAGLEARYAGLFTEADSIDVFNRTAHIKGYAQPNSTVVIKGGTTNKTVPVDANGEWNTTVKNLDLNANEFSLESFDEDNVSLGTSEFTVDVKPTALSATVTEPHLGLGTADVEITGTPGLTINYQGKTATLDKDGKETVTFDGLSLGNNDVTIEQYDGATKIGATLNYKINLMITALTATAAFDTRGTNFDAIVSGKAEGDADITITDDNGHVTTTKADPKGAWSTPVQAPGAGLQDFEVSQSINGGDGGSIDTDLNYGNAVEINSPRNNSSFAGGTLAFQGEGQYKGSVEIFEKGNTTPLKSTLGINDGSWIAKVDNVDGDLKHTYTAVMKSQGNLTTTDEVVVNADKAEAKHTDVTQTNLQSGSTFTPGNNTFTGKGTPGAAISVVPTNPTGEAPSTAIVDPDGNWKVDRYLGDGDYTMSITQNDKGATDQITGITLTPKRDGATLPFSVNVKDGDSFTPGGDVTFSGTADGLNKGTVTLNWISPSGYDPITVPVNANGTWNLTLFMGNGPYTFDFVQDVNGVKTSSGNIGLLPTGWAANQPFKAFTHDGDTFTLGTNTFNGEGKPGSTISMNIVYPTGIAPLTTTVNKYGSWSIPFYLGNGPYTVEFVQNDNGQTSTSGNLHLMPEGFAVDKPFTLESPTKNGTFTPGGEVEWKGTGAGKSGDTVTLHFTSPSNQPDTIVPVNPDGTWSIHYWMGNGPYTAEVTQTTTQGTVTDRISAGTITPAGFAQDKPFTANLNNGDTFTPGNVTFTGTGAGKSGATLTTTLVGMPYGPYTTNIGQDGNWDFTLTMGNGPYTLNFTQTLNGVKTDLGNMTITPTP